MTKRGSTALDNRDIAALTASKRVDVENRQKPVCRARLRILARLAAWFIMLVNALARVRHFGFEKFLAAAAGSEPIMIVSWHGAMISSIYCYRRRNVVIMTSLSEDGDLLTQTLYNLGFKCLRGSSSRGGARGLLEMVRLIRQGMVCAVTVDGPRGPRHEVKPGAVLAAQKTGALVFPLGVGYSRCLRLNNWDKTEIALPGSQVVAVTGDSFKIPATMPVEEARRLIGDRINACKLEAERIVNHD